MRVLFVSGSVGLGHATRDLAIAAECGGTTTLERRRAGERILASCAEPARATAGP